MAEELRALLGGLSATLVGSASGGAPLPLARPDLQRDTPVVGCLAAGFFFANWGIRLLLVSPLVRAVLSLKRPVRIKFEQSVMEALLYGGFTVIGLRVVPSQEWVWPSSKWWIDFENGSHLAMRSDLRCYYLMYIARYMQGIVSVLLEPKRKDFFAMILHHVVTVLVIYISYVHGWNRVGVCVMVLLDPADVPLHVAKICKYIADASRSHAKAWQFLADRLFEVFAVTFLVTRLILYGYVCWSAHIEAGRYFLQGWAAWTCVALLETLLGLQVYWMFLILKVAVRLLMGEGADDCRSDDEDEDGDSGESRKER